MSAISRREFVKRGALFLPSMMAGVNLLLPRKSAAQAYLPHRRKAFRGGGGGGGTTPPTFVQSIDGESGSFQVTFGSNVGNGNCLVAAVYWLPNTASLTGITSDRSAAFTLLDNPTAESGNSGRAAQGYAMTTSGGSCTITFAFSAGLSAVGMLAHEYSGVHADIIDNGGAAHEASDAPNLGTGADAYTSGNFTTTTNNCKIFGWLFDVNKNDTMSPGTGFTGRILTQAGGRGETEDKTLATAGVTAATFTSSASFIFAVVGGMGLKPAA